MLTGTLSSMTRNQAVEALEAAGGKVTGQVTGKTDYVVAGQAPGSKIEKAAQKGVAVIDEDQFISLVREAAAAG